MLLSINILCLLFPEWTLIGLKVGVWLSGSHVSMPVLVTIAIHINQSVGWGSCWLRGWDARYGQSGPGAGDR
jgi:hypothetical protein